ncbi:MAG: choice-of-anchor J domain-containing protein, partial [Dehalococcoidia bacterium]|nr:choice-of-anchor J domain-containing protein [Dehalococcoidia bacterium]
LSFWHRYSLQANNDWGYVDVSTDQGNTWTTIYFVTGHHTDWKEEQIDLSQYAGGILTFRFRLKSDGDLRYDGWYIDDVSIAETTAIISYPFFDDMESGEGNWLSSSWELATPGHSPDHCFTDSPEGNGPRDVAYTSLTLASTIDLSTAENPQMTFWEHYYSYTCYVQASSDWGRTWTTLASYSGTQDNWVQRQVDLTNYEGLSTVRIRFRLYSYYGRDGWYIDDVRIEDTPKPHPQLYTPTDVTMHGAHVCWEQYDPGIHGTGLSLDYEPQFAPFGRYEIYRDTSPSVDRSDTLVFETTSIAETCFDDVYCILQPNYYYYRMYLVDQNGMYSIGSNPQKAEYTIPLVGYPFFDDMESGTDNWEWCSPWGLAGPSHSDEFSWQDSPGGTSYMNNVNNMLTTTIDDACFELLA